MPAKKVNEVEFELLKNRIDSMNNELKKLDEKVETFMKTERQRDLSILLALISTVLAAVLKWLTST